jgi:hypothetical protein
MGTELARLSSATGGRVPALIAAAGDQAVAAYHAFLGTSAHTSITRRHYQHRIARFSRWAETRGLTLDAVTAADAFAYAAGLAAEMSPHSTTVALTPLRGLFHRLTTSGAIADNPFRSVPASGRRPRPQIPLSRLKEMVLELDPAYAAEDEEFFHAGLVMLAPASLGTIDPLPISRFTGVPLPRVRQFAERLLANRRWTTDGKIAVDSDDPDDLPVAMILNVLVASGMLECRPAEETDEPCDAGEPASQNPPSQATEATDDH